MSKESRTELYENLWLKPVERVEELPAAANEGQICFVTGEGRTYAFREGQWIVASGAGKKKDA